MPLSSRLPLWVHESLFLLPLLPFQSGTGTNLRRLKNLCHCLNRLCEQTNPEQRLHSGRSLSAVYHRAVRATCFYRLCGSRKTGRRIKHPRTEFLLPYPESCSCREARQADATIIHRKRSVPIQREMFLSKEQE